MTRMKICRNFPKKPAQALLALLLSIGSCMILPHNAFSQESTDNTTVVPQENTDNTATAPQENTNSAVQNSSSPASISFSPALIQSWKDYIKNAPAIIAKFQSDQAARRQAAKVIMASGERNMDDLIKQYPFLQADFKNVKETQQQATDYINKNLDHSIDTSPHVQIAESRDSQSGVNILFVSKSGDLWCGAHGCTMDVYVDDGTGYKKSNEFIVAKDLWLSRVNGQAALYFSPPEDPNTPELILSGHTFVKNIPPQPEPQSQGFVEWRHELEEAGQWPPR